MGALGIARFLTHPAPPGNVSVRTRMQALQARVYVEKPVREHDLGPSRCPRDGPSAAVETTRALGGRATLPGGENNW